MDIGSRQPAKTEHRLRRVPAVRAVATGQRLDGAVEGRVMEGMPAQPPFRQLDLLQGQGGQALLQARPARQQAEQFAALAVQAVLIGFIPMLMGTGGNSGAQASTAVIRSISLGDTEPEDVGRVIWKEFRVAILCGITLAAVNFVKMLLVDRILLNNDGVTLTVAAVVSLSIVLIVMFAKVVGSVLPIAAEKLGVDPAVMANPLISTITDAVSLLIYFEIAKLMISF